MLSCMFTERRVFYTWWNCLLLQPTKCLAIKLHIWRLCSTQSSWASTWLGHFLKACWSVVLASSSFEAVESQEKLKLKITPKYNNESILPLILKAREGTGGHNTSSPAGLWLGVGRVGQPGEPQRWSWWSGTHTPITHFVIVFKAHNSFIRLLQTAVKKTEDEK